MAARGVVVGGGSCLGPNRTHVNWPFCQSGRDDECSSSCLSLPIRTFAGIATKFHQGHLVTLNKARTRTVAYTRLRARNSEGEKAKVFG
jgi:hypothetical protein